MLIYVPAICGTSRRNRNVRHHRLRLYCPSCCSWKHLNLRNCPCCCFWWQKRKNCSCKKSRCYSFPWNGCLKCCRMRSGLNVSFRYCPD